SACCQESSRSSRSTPGSARSSASRADRPHLSVQLVGRLEGLAHVGGDAATVGNLVTVRARPVADLAGTGAHLGAALGPAGAATGATSGADVLRERVSQRLGVLVVEVDLVAAAVETECHRLGGDAAVPVVLEGDLHLLPHILCLSGRSDIRTRVTGFAPQYSAWATKHAIHSGDSPPRI